MGLFDRLGRVIRANLNSLVNQTEDPEKILEQAVMEMQEDLILLRQAVAQAIATQKRLERQCKQHEVSAQEWLQRAQLAMSKGDEALAREALIRRKPYLDTAQAIRQQLEQQSGMVSKLKQDMQSLERKIAEARAKKDLYVARARSAVATQRMNEMLGNLNTSSTLSAFERMEEKVHQLEARAEVSSSLGTDDLEKKFTALEAGDVDAELAQLKAQISGNNPTALPPS